MIKPDLFTGKEPKIRVGLILPEDRLTSVSVRIPKTIQSVFIDSRKTNVRGELEITIENEQLKIGDFTGDSITIHGARLETLSQELPTLYPVAAGRNFHWETSLKPRLPGDIEITIVGGTIFATNILFLEDYLACVATSEMSSSCPAPFIEAQTISARSWLLASFEGKHDDIGIDACNDDCCQRYQGAGYLTESSLSGTRMTAGKVLTWKGEICDSRYSKSCGGIIEDFKTAWNLDGPEYLKAHPDSKDDGIQILKNENDAETWIKSSPKSCFCSPEFIPENELGSYIGSVDKSGEYYRWEKEYSGDDILEIINAKLKLDAASIRNLRVLARGASGRISRLSIEFMRNNQVNEIILESELAIRQALDPSTLFSSAVIFETDRNEIGNIIKLRIYGAGWGHGVGLCQIGALGMSLSGYDSSSILNHYYPGTIIRDLY